MSADLACKACRGSGWERSFVNPWPDEPCPNCHGEGRRLPTLDEWDAQERLLCEAREHGDRMKAAYERAMEELVSAQAERDRYREALEAVASHDWGYVIGYDVAEGSYHIDAQKVARAALDGKE